MGGPIPPYNLREFAKKVFQKIFETFFPEKMLVFYMIFILAVRGGQIWPSHPCTRWLDAGGG